MEDKQERVEIKIPDLRILRIYLGEKALGVPFFNRCHRCHSVLGKQKNPSKTGLCFPCYVETREVPRTAPCRLKAVNLYEAGVPVEKIARSCDITKERVYQFLRPTGLLQSQEERRKQKNNSRHYEKLVQKLKNKKQRVMRQWAIIRLYKSGATHQDLQRWGFWEAQGVLTRAGVPKRRRGTRKKSKYENMTDGDWHVLDRFPKGSGPWLWAARHGYICNVKTFDGVVKVRFRPKGNR